ncbi:MAG TPA: SDR family oxidoreductase, partial [Myxococcaceae bacterium]|nr:SDR family oxidoreductase [Myxococcaceae bacterium]
TAPAGFEFLMREVLAPLVCGGSVVFASASGSMEWSLDGTWESLRCAHFTPAGLAAFVQGCSEETAARLSALRVVLCSGGSLRPELVQAFRRRVPSRLVYLLSPPGSVSELAVAGKHTLQPVRVLDRTGQLAPVGVPGTIHVGERKTPVIGRWTAEGVLEVLGTRPGTLWWEGRILDLEQLSASFMRRPAVEACHVVTRVVDGLDELIAYVVPAAAVPLAQLEERFRALLPEPAPRVTVVPVSTLPLAPDGRIDERALSELESIDASLVERWEQRLSQVPGVARVKVVATDASSEPRKLVHVNDLLPRLRMNGAADRHSTSASVLGRAGGELIGKPALSDGGPLELPEDAPKTLTEAFLRTAQAGDGRGITLYQDEHGPAFVPYAELLQASKRILSGLRAAGLRRGDSVILQLENLRDHFASFWACVLGGISPVCVTTPSSYDRKNSVLNKLYNVWELLRRPAILTNEHLVGPLSGASSLYGQTFRVLAVNVLELHPPAAELHPAEPTDVVFFQLTSGSTGIPKCIQETHRGIIHHIHGSARFNGYTSEDVTLNWLPMDHVVPILTCHLKDTYLGLRQVHVRTPVVLADPLRWLELMERHRVTHSWSPNFGFKLVNDALAKAPGRSWDLSPLKLLMNAGEQVTVPVIDEFLRRTAPFGVREQVMQPAFGMAEVCTCMTYANDYAIGKGARRVLKSALGGVLQDAGPDEPEAITFVDLGPPMPGVQIRITDGENRVVPERVIGRFQIKGNVTTPGYLHNDEANREAFVGDGWFNSGDLGFIRDGRLTITGREKEMIIVRGANFYCYELEDAVGSVEGVEPTFAAACAVDDPSTGSEGLALFFVPRKPGIDVALIRAIKERVTQDFGLAPSFVVPLAKEAFPKTTSGKIQRTHLKKELARGAFDELLKGIDLAAENENTVPEWFLRRVWQRKEPRAAVEELRGCSLVFADAEGLGDALWERLGEGTVRVRPGAGFEKLGEREYALDPRQPEGYARLIAGLQADGLWVERVFHLWTYGPPADPSSGDGFLHDAQVTGAASLLLLSKALANARGANTVRLLVGSSHVQARGPEDRIAFERAPVLGLVKTIPQEWPRLDCRHVDLPLESAWVNAQRLIREALAPGRDREVAYRDGGRWVPRLEKAALEPREELPFQRGELVLLSGGLGGIGLELAKWLLEQHGVRLLLVGRTPLDAEAPEDPAEGLAVRESLSERAAQLHKLAQHGEVSYGAADIADEARVRELVQQAEARWGTKLAGVVHLAGVFPARLLEEETAEGLARTLRPKLEGARVLERVLGPDGFFIGFGSIHGVFGGAASGAYAAANAALEAFVEDRRRRGLGRSFLFAWSNWDETGMSRGYLLKEPSLAQGYEMISPRRGIWSLLAGLRSGHRSLLVGVDARQPNVRRHVAAGAVPLRRLMAYVAPAAGHSPAAEARAVEVADRFGRRSRCEVLEIPELPVTPSGEVDVARLLGMGRRRSASEERVPPRTGVERTIAAVWREVLGVEGIDIHTSFFAMGGQSILLIQVLSRLKQALNRELSVVELFRYPTVSALAAYLGKEQAAKPSFSKAAERAQKQREAVRQRVVPPRGRR